MLKRFSSFTLDTANECVWRGKRRIQLAPKAYGVLRYLVENPARIVTKEELLQAVWPETFVQESVLKTCVLDIRKALGDSPGNPKYIATAHRRGYRFVGEPVSHMASASEQPSAPEAAFLVGRCAALETLHALRKRTEGGARQVVFVTGEAGIGKSTLIARFLEETAQEGRPRVLRGQCVDHIGASEAYYPVFDAFAQGAKDGAAAGIIDALRKCAPAWLIQMPELVSSSERETLKQDTFGATRERMLREMSEVIEALSRDEPLILVLDDLHWSDASTLDLISMIASRGGNARLLVIASYRPVDVILANHPVKSLKQTLLARGRCLELELEMFGQNEVSEYLSLRFPNHQFPVDFARLVHLGTGGNPLFVANVLEFALSRSLIGYVGGEWHMNSTPDDFDFRVPESLSKTIEAQIERLTPEEQNVLEAASVVGVSFTIPMITGSDEAGPWEDCCDSLTRRNLFLQASGVIRMSAGAADVEYHFKHSLYRDILYRRLPPGRRMRLHRAIGERMELMVEQSTNAASPELARHFRECLDHPRAVLYLRLLAQRSVSRHALPEAVDALLGALELASHLQEPGRRVAQFEMTEQLGLVYRLMGRFDSALLEFERMCRLARESGSLDGELRAQLWLASAASFHDRERCLRAAEAVIALCADGVDAELRANALGQVAYWNLLFRGWNKKDARASTLALEEARKSGDRAALALHASRHSFFQALSSEYRDACQTAREGVRIATEVESMLDYSVGHYFEAWALLHLGEWGELREVLRAAIDMANRNGHDLWALLFGLHDAFLQIQTFSFGSAREASLRYLARAREIKHPLSVQISLVLLGFAELGSGDPQAARRAFTELLDWQCSQRILMDWIWKLPLHFGLVQTLMAQGELHTASKEADRFLALASSTADRTWRALAHYARAQVAFLARDLSTARQEITLGLGEIEGREAPLAAWRLHALAAEALDDPSHLAQARAVILRLADSLAADDPLRGSLLARAPFPMFHAGVGVMGVSY